MAWSIDTTGLKRVDGYSEAYQLWEKAKPWRNMTGEYDKRPLADIIRRKSHMNLRKKHNEDIAFELYSTDVLTYHVDGSVSFEYYSSISTDLFVNAICPSGLSVSLNHNGDYHLVFATNGRGYRWGTSGKLYNICDGATFVPLGEVERVAENQLWAVKNPAQIKPFTRMSLDQSVTRPLYRSSGFIDWRDWVRAAHAMAPEQFDRKVADISVEATGGQNVTRWNVLPKLADRSEWMTLAAMAYPHPWELRERRSFGRRVTPDPVKMLVETVRGAVVNTTPDAIHEETFTHLESFNEFHSLKRQNTKIEAM